MLRIITYCQACRQGGQCQGAKVSHQDTTETDILSCAGTLGLTLSLPLSMLRSLFSLTTFASSDLGLGCAQMTLMIWGEVHV